MTASELAQLHQALAHLIAAAEAMCEAEAGMEPWDMLTDAIDAAVSEVPPDMLARARATALELI